MKKKRKSRWRTHRTNRRVPLSLHWADEHKTTTCKVYKAVDDLYNAAFEFKRPFKVTGVGKVYLRFLLTIVPLDKHIVRVAVHMEWSTRKKKKAGIQKLFNISGYTRQRLIDRLMLLFKPYRGAFIKGNKVIPHEVVHRKEGPCITHISAHMMMWFKRNPLDYKVKGKASKKAKEKLGRVMYLLACQTVHASIYDFVFAKNLVVT